MPLPYTYTIPGCDLPVVLTSGETSIFVGANGSGKSRLAIAIEDALADEAFRVAAHRALILNPNVTKTSEDTAMTRLRTGVDGPSSAGYTVGAHRKGSRWGDKPATHLLNDFEALLQVLYAEQANAGVSFLAAHSANAAAKRPTPKFDLLREIWLRIYPTRPLKIRADSIVVEVSGPSGSPLPYSAADMSDGERAVFYMLGQVLVAPVSSVMIFDEPELHVHRAILGRVWDELEAARVDCAFVLITHDLDFAASREGKKYVLKDYKPWSGWSVEEVPEDTGFDEQTTTLILGSRQNVLFIESDGRGIDLAIYRACYPSWTVIPRGGCDAVIQSVRAMQANASLHRIKCAGIVDNDGREPSVIAYLASKGIAVLPVSEIENLFALPGVATAILKEDSFSDAAIALKLTELRHAIFADATDPNHEEQVVLGHVRRVLDAQLKKLSFEGCKAEGHLVNAFQNDVAGIDVALIAGRTRKKLRDAVAANDLRGLLELYDRKGALLETTGQVLKGHNKKKFVAWVTRVMGDPNKAGIRAAINAELSTVTAV